MSPFVGVGAVVDALVGAAAAFRRSSESVCAFLAHGADPALSSASALEVAAFFDLPDMLALLQERRPIVSVLSGSLWSEHPFGYNGGVSDGRSTEDLEADLEAEMAAVCATINAATGRLVALVAQVLASGEWEGEGIHSPSQWVAWRCGLSSAHARSLVAMARAVGDRPATRAALEAGQLSADQAALVCRQRPTRSPGGG